MLLEASTFLWKMIKLKYHFLIMYSDLLSKVHLRENGIWKVSPNIYLENNISILLFSTKMYLLPEIITRLIIMTIRVNSKIIRTGRIMVEINVLQYI